jgi:hypothetical protein
VKKSTLVPKRNGKRFIDMHSANRIAYEPARRLLTVYRRTGFRPGRGGISNHPAHKATQEPHGPGGHEQPEQKPCDAGKKGHTNLGVAGCSFENPPFVLVRECMQGEKGESNEKA